MRKLYVSFLLLFFPATSQATSPIACVESDVANTLLAFPGLTTNETFSYDVPEGVTLPGSQSSFSLIGSRSSEVMTMVTYKTSQKIGEVENDIRQQAEAEGWVDLMANLPFRPRGGFQSATRNLFNMLNFCHDEHGNVQVFVTDNPDSGSYVRYSVTARTNSQGCLNPSRAYVAMTPVELPTLSMPNGVDVVESRGAGSTVLRSTDYHAGSIADYFNEQIGEQSLTLESAWSGTAFSGSVWTSPEGDRFVTLIVVDIGDNRYRAMLQAMPMGKDSGRSSTISVQAG